MAYGIFRKVTTLEFFQHHFAKSGHGDGLLMTRQLISTFRQSPLHYLTRSVRRTSGFVLADHPGVVDLRSGLLRFFILYVEVKCEGQRESLEVLRDSPFRDSASGCQNASTLSKRGLIDPPKIDVTLVIYRRA